MRMPIFSYFLVVGSVLTGLLLWFGNDSPPNETALEASQAVGIPTFRPEPEPEHARATAVNFAAEYKRPERKPAKAAESVTARKTTPGYSKPEPRSRFAEFPNNNLSIH